MRLIASTFLALLVLSAGGCFKKANPDNLVIRVTASYPGAGAQTVADVIATPIEIQVSGIEGATLLESESGSDGTYTLTVHLESTVNPDIAEVLVQNRVNLALPALPELCRMQGVVVSKVKNPPTAPVRIAVCDTKEQGVDELLKTAKTFAEQMKAKKFAADVTTLPEPQPELHIKLDREELDKQGASVDDVLKVIRDTGSNVTDNDFNKFGRLHFIQATPKPIFAGDDWKKLEVTGANDKRIPLDTVMSVREVRVPQQMFRVNLYPAVVLSAKPPEGTSAKDAMTQSLKLSETALPKGYKAENLLPAP